MVNVGRLLQLRELNLYQNAGITDVGVVGQLTNLKVFDIIGNSSTDKGFSKLRGLHKIKQLKIYSVPFNDKDIEILNEMKEFIVLVSLVLKLPMRDWFTLRR